MPGYRRYYTSFGTRYGLGGESRRSFEGSYKSTSFSDDDDEMYFSEGTKIIPVNDMRENNTRASRKNREKPKRYKYAVGAEVLYAPEGQEYAKTLKRRGKITSYANKSRYYVVRDNDTFMANVVKEDNIYLLSEVKEKLKEAVDIAGKMKDVNNGLINDLKSNPPVIEELKEIKETTGELNDQDISVKTIQEDNGKVVLADDANSYETVRYTYKDEILDIKDSVKKLKKITNNNAMNAIRNYYASLGIGSMFI